MTSFQKIKQKKKDIKYPLLYDASTFLEDEFWKNFFIDISKGKCPKKITINNTTIVLGSKRNMNIYFYGDKTACQIAFELKPMIIDMLNILSDYDMTSSIGKIDENLNEFNNWKLTNNWKKIKNKKMRDDLIDTYVLFRKKTWNLNWDQTRDLQNVINNAIYIFRTHKSIDIIMNDGNILNINDIIFKNNNIINKRSTILQKDPENEEKQKDIKNIWTSYIKLICDDSFQTEIEQE
jgi:hypothetical protein